jgi:hypothetical protein
MKNSNRHFSDEESVRALTEIYLEFRLPLEVARWASKADFSLFVEPKTNQTPTESIYSPFVFIWKTAADLARTL